MKSPRPALWGAVAAILFGAAIAAAQIPETPAAIPDTPAGQRMAAWLEVMNRAGDPEAERAFYDTQLAPGIREVFSFTAFQDMMAETRRDNPGIRFHAALASEPARLEALCRDANGRWLRIRVMVSPEAENRIAGFMIDDDADPPEVLNAGPAPDDAAFVRDVTAYVDGRTSQDRFSGTVLILRGDRTLVRGAWGEANRRYHVPNALDTKFNLGSMNKMFTAVAVAQLAARGLVDYDATVGTYLPDFSNPEVRDKVTVHHLLSHTSGMGTHFTDAFMDGSKTRFRVIQDYVPLFAGDSLAFEPGERFQYSNAGFFVLGLVVEAVSGQSYYDYVREHIYAPAGMTNTDCYDMDIPVSNVAVGYTEDRFDDPRENEDHAPWMDAAGGLRENTYLHSIKGGPAGGGFSTVEDLVRFARALTDGTLLDAEDLDRLTTAKSEPRERGDDVSGYGYGFRIHTIDGVRYFGHGGGFPGINGELRIYPEQGVVMAALANLDLAAGKVLDYAGRVLPRSE